MTRAEQEHFTALLRLLRGLARRGDARAMLSILTSIHTADPHPSIAVLVANMKRQAIASPLTVLSDCPLQCENVTAETCVARQERNEKRGPSSGFSWQGDEDDATAKKRGKSYRYPNCVTRHCEVGAHVRLSLRRKAS
ncbi:MAG: hypothetical protein WCK73_07915 [Deltaproteobacteria bacterium]